MSNTSITVVARSDQVQQGNTDPSRDWLFGITTVSNTDPQCIIFMYQIPQNVDVPDPLPALRDVLINGMPLVILEQFQFQDISGGTDPGRILVACPPFPVDAGTTVAFGNIVCATAFRTSTALRDGSFLLADFVQPAASSSVTINTDTTWMTVSQEIHIAGAGIFVVASIADSTHASVTFQGIASALVKIAA